MNHFVENVIINIYKGFIFTKEMMTIEEANIPCSKKKRVSKKNVVIEDDTVKKRGRKPKGGKILTIPKNMENELPNIPNIILHLKCSFVDLQEYNQRINQYVSNPLQYNPVVPPNIMTYNIEESSNFFDYKNETIETPAYTEDKIEKSFSFGFSEIKPQRGDEEEEEEEEDNENMSNKMIHSKINKLKHQLYKNTNPEKKSACFWCTFEYDNQTCYIPKYESDGQIFGYGSFCRPECAVAYLMKENIDDTMKFERYNLLNYVYGKNQKKNIKPAPNPYYLLDKFYGNLSVQEYRKLLKSEHMLVVLEKPITRILPELHEDSEDITSNIFTLNNNQMNRGISNRSSSSVGGNYKVKRQSEKQKGPSKSSIMNDTFGFR